MKIKINILTWTEELNIIEKKNLYKHTSLNHSSGTRQRFFRVGGWERFSHPMKTKNSLHYHIFKEEEEEDLFLSYQEYIKSTFDDKMKDCGLLHT